ncbi:DUF2066 domain-containing protein [Ciceribacter thiooxidans]|uniref:DUF2066 domain-containing protein n=1 Tax=Ciceribacter thiooxidans TaxID=1969821 RepID=A0ABV7I9F1_9HYPH|nr:DUF2066 domain-containing protein [Ciceribacter thiooxidans]
MAILLFLVVLPGTASADGFDELYSARTIVTGQGEKNRETGFRDCLDHVLVRVSGNQRLTHRPEMKALRERAGTFVRSFSYRDRLAGRPIHDEQGTYDRPHDLTCLYDPMIIDELLTSLGSRPWRDARPSLAVFLDVQRGDSLYSVSPDDPRDAAMRESFALGAEPMAMRVSFPSSADVDAWAAGPGAPELARAAKAAGAELALVGKLIWSDADLGWTGTWRLAAAGKEEYVWTVRGVNFDEAFRVAVRGAAQILSGNGSP